MPILVALVLGFLVGILVNLIADYLPGRRHHYLASTSPFASSSAIPPKLSFFPRRADGRLWSLPLWSGVVALLTNTLVFDPPRRVRRIATELGLAVAFAWITGLYGDRSSLPFLLFYAAVFALIIIIDVEHRWIMFDTIWPPALVALVEAWFQPRIGIIDALRGGLTGFIVLFALYQFGFVFGALMQVTTGRRVGRTILGFGDVRMATLSGLILGWQTIGLALLVMIFTGAIAALIFMTYKRLRKGRYRLFSAIPYGPYIVIGTATMLYIPWVMAPVLFMLLHEKF